MNHRTGGLETMDMSASSPRPPSPRGRTAARPEWLIDAWLELLPPRQAGTLSVLHRAVLAASPSLMPSIKWGNVIYLREGRPVAQLTPHKRSAHLQLTLPRPARRRRPGAPMRLGPEPGLLRFRHGQEIDAEAVTWQVVGVLRQLPR